MAPWLERYETVCLVRHPVDRAQSWWRYRSRSELGRAENWTGDLSFPEFAELLISGDVPLGTATNFVTDLQGELIVDRLYRYDHLDQACAWMSQRLGIDPPVLGRANVSPDREARCDDACRRRLEEHFAADLALYDAAR